MWRNHERPVAALAGGPPVVDDQPTSIRSSLCGVNSLAGRVRREGDLGIPGAQLGQRSTLPRLGLPPVGGQLDGAQAANQTCERTPGVDLEELKVVADEHNLGTGCFDVTEEMRKRTGTHHGGLVHHHGSRIEDKATTGDPPEEPVDRQRRDPGTGLKFGCGPSGEGSADDPEPALAGGRQPSGLASAGNAFDGFDAGARSGEGSNLCCCSPLRSARETSTDLTIWELTIAIPASRRRGARSMS
jgi:hypothetical protein